jgi:glycosyltransferase involved in cell wall biosynthesis
VSAYVRGKGARGPVIEAPQSVDDAFWSGPAEPSRRAAFQVLFAGRLSPEKGVDVLLRAWRASGLAAHRPRWCWRATVRLPAPARESGAAHVEGAVSAAQLRNFYAGSDVVVVPSVPTRDFWSRGAWSSTKPSTGECQSSPPTPWAPPQGASSSMSAPV